MLACLVLLTALAGGICAAEQVETSFDADSVEFSFDHKLVTLRGDAHLFSKVVEDPTRHVRIEADLIEGDISRGRFEMIGDVRIVTPRGTMEGDSAVYNAQTAHYSLRRGGIMVPMGEGEPPEVTCGFAYAQEIATEGDLIYMTNGRFTTCSRADPHYCLQADKFRWNPETQQVVVYGGSVKVYGLEIPVLPKIPYAFGESEQETPSLLPFPTYSSRDGLRLGWSFNIGDPMANPTTEVRLHWRQLRPLQVSTRTYYDFNDHLRGRLRLGLREDVRQDIDRIVPLDRFPEVGLDGDWRLWGGNYQLETDLSLGHYRQRREDTLQPVAEDRLRLQARLTGNPDGVYEPGEMWWWVDGSEALYGDGSHYAAFGAGLGSAARLTDWLAGNAEIRQWATGGRTPFVWDDVDVKTELESNLQVKVTDDWRVRLGSRYDISDGETRVWDAELRRREHCLTWKLSYSDISDNFMIGAEINGLFGNDEPPEDGCPADGPPDYWAVHGMPAEASGATETDVEEPSQTQSEADAASEAMETP
jgi:hypothetical protein